MRAMGYTPTLAKLGNVPLDIEIHINNFRSESHA